MSAVNILWQVVSARHLYRAAVEPVEATQLLGFILGMWYLYLGVLKHVFGYGCVVYILITKWFDPERPFETLTPEYGGGAAKRRPDISGRVRGRKDLVT